MGTILFYEWTYGTLYGSRDRDIWVLYCSRTRHVVYFVVLGTGSQMCEYYTVHCENMLYITCDNGLINHII